MRANQRKKRNPEITRRVGSFSKIANQGVYRGQNDDQKDQIGPERMDDLYGSVHKMDFYGVKIEKFIYLGFIKVEKDSSPQKYFLWRT